MPEIVQPQSEIVTQLIANKLLAINQMIRNSQFTTRNDQSRGDLRSSTSQAIQQYLSALQSSDTSVAKTVVARGNINPSTIYNQFWSAVNNDLTALYAEANNVGQSLVNNYNYIASDIQNILIQLKLANSSIQNYELLTSSPIGGQQTFIQKFIDTSQIDYNSPLLTSLQCNIDTVEGIATLGVTSTTTLDSTDILSATIGGNSNGTTYGNITLTDVIPGNELDLFQYQITSSSPAPQLLTLDFTVQLTAATILNFIRIVPNNFGTTTWPTITALDVSKDGVNFVSVRDMLLSVDNDPTQFILAPYTSNFAGEGRYSFLPQAVLLVHFTIQQTTPYFNSATGLYTWAIGIKTIQLDSNQFASTSQLISAPYTLPAGISKISLNADELPPVTYSNGELTSLGNIAYDISVDGGMTWRPISQIYLSGQNPNAPEILNINNVESQLNTTDPSSINTPQQVTSIIYRIRMAQNALAIPSSTIAPYFSPVIRNLMLNIVTQEVV